MRKRLIATTPLAAVLLVIAWVVYPPASLPDPADRMPGESLDAFAVRLCDQLCGWPETDVRAQIDDVRHTPSLTGADHLRLYHETFAPEQAEQLHACDDCVQAIIDAGLSE